MNGYAWYRSKTFWGGVLAAAAHVISDPKNPLTWAEGVGVVVAAKGARDAIAKNGAGQ